MRELYDREIYARRERATLSFYAEIIRPEQACTSFVIADATAGRAPGTHVLLCGRPRSSPFRPRDLALIRQLAPAVAVGHAFVASYTPIRRKRAPLEHERLTRREHEVLEYAILGVTTQQIALALGTSVNTVKHQLRSLMKKLGAGSRAELVRIALLELAHPIGASQILPLVRKLPSAPERPRRVGGTEGGPPPGPSGPTPRVLC